MAQRERRQCLQLGEREIAYTLIRHPRRKRLTLAVTPQAGVEVRGPLHVTRRGVEEFVARHGSWLLNRLEAVQRRSRHRPHLAPGATLPLLDASLTLVLKPMVAPRVRQVGGELWAPAGLEDLDRLEALLEQWYRTRARGYLEPRLRDWAARMGQPVTRLTVRGQRTRWGSCSTRGTVSLNWRLLWLPTAVVDYVLIHELSHMAHMDHSPAFWQAVARWDPEFRRHRAILKGFRGPW
ncbi:MAG: M48 family metallopeptidase [Magnetococcales bacterium]|nr:M48 family metallopeptidase [Magnetococcales bacterium]